MSLVLQRLLSAVLLLALTGCAYIQEVAPVEDRLEGTRVGPCCLPGASSNSSLLPHPVDAMGMESRGPNSNLAACKKCSN